MYPKNTDWQRNYPNTIKGAIVFEAHKTIPADVERLKEMGINTIVVFIPNKSEDDKFVSALGSDSSWLQTVAAIKKANFAVVMTPDYWNSNQDKTIDFSENDHLKMAKERTIELAKIAEEYKVEYFSPYNEFNGNIESAYHGRFTGDFVDNPEVIKITNNWHAEVLTEIKKVYKGKVIAKLDPITIDYDLSGYDYVGITLIHQNLPVDEFYKKVKTWFEPLTKVADKSKAKWIVSESIMEYGNDTDEKDSQTQTSDELQDDYFVASFEAYKSMDQINAGGYIFAGWTWPGAGVKDRPAEDVLKNFFVNSIEF